MTPGSEFTLQKLIIDLRTEDDKTFTIAMTRNWNNVMELWVMKKCKKHASIVASYLPAWTHTLCRNKVLPSFTVEDQKAALETK